MKGRICKREVLAENVALHQPLFVLFTPAPTSGAEARPEEKSTFPVRWCAAAPFAAKTLTSRGQFPSTRHGPIFKASALVVIVLKYATAEGVAVIHLFAPMR